MSLYSFMADKEADEDDEDDEKGAELDTFDRQVQTLENKSNVSGAKLLGTTTPIPMSVAPKPKSNSSSAALTVSSSPPIAIAVRPYIPSGGPRRIDALRASDEAIVGSPPGVHDDRRRAFSNKKY